MPGCPRQRFIFRTSRIPNHIVPPPGNERERPHFEDQEHPLLEGEGVAGEGISKNKIWAEVPDPNLDVPGYHTPVPLPPLVKSKSIPKPK